MDSGNIDKLSCKEKKKLKKKMRKKYLRKLQYQSSQNSGEEVKKILKRKENLEEELKRVEEENRIANELWERRNLEIIV